MPHGVMIVLIVVVIVVVFVFGAIAAAKRRKELAAWAHSRGLQFDSRKDRGMDERFPFKCLRNGHSRFACNVCKGEINGHTITAFDYQYTTGSGKNQQTHRLSAVIVRSSFPLKPLFIRREGMFDKITEFFGMDDIDFESAEFSRKFFVKSPDKKWAYDVIHQRMMEFLLASPEFTIEFDGMNIIVWRQGRLAPAGFDSAVNLATGILERIPEYVVKQQKQ